MRDSTGTTEHPQISLPAGGGAIRSSGETFSVNTFTGTAQFAIPIALSPARSDVQPQLQLDYSAATGNGPFGQGFSLSVPSVACRTEKGLPTYNDHGESPDVFVLSSTEELVPVIEPDPGRTSWQPEAVPDAVEIVNGVEHTYRIRRYRPRVETQHARIERREDVADHSVHWRVTTRDNLTRVFGRSAAARIADPDDATHIFRWLLEEVEDAFGNRVEYSYKLDEAVGVPTTMAESGRRYAQRYPKRIRYGNFRAAAGTTQWAFHLVFDYGEHDLDDAYIESGPWQARPDRFSDYRAGFELRTTRRCRRVLLFHHFPNHLGPDPILVRSTDLGYHQDSDTGLSVLSTVTQRSYEREDAIPGGPPWRSEDGLLESRRYRVASVPPLTLTYRMFDLERRTLTRVGTDEGEAPRRSLATPGVTLIDRRGDGLPDVLDASSGKTIMWTNQGRGRLAAGRPDDSIPPPFSLGSPGVCLADVTGDGRADLLVQRPDVAGFFPADADVGFGSFRPFAQTPSLDLTGPSVRMIDLTGDGRADVLASSSHHFIWFPSLGEAGFGEPRTIERRRDLADFPDLDLSNPRVRLADMSGDGLVDIVLLHSGRIDYWPNQGYGRFGARITMEGSPHWISDSDLDRLHLADLDGTGTADLVYVGDGEVRLWRNRFGNGWSDEVRVTGTPCIPDPGGARFVDFLGSGTATLLYTQDVGHGAGSAWWCLDLLGSAKPWTLASIDNGMGALQRIEYLASTAFMIEDREQGHPWASYAPLPIQVVSAIEYEDAVDGSLLRHGYRYAHPYYDGRERELRGFGLIDRIDTELFDPAVDVDSPPRLERTWYHTGAYLDGNRLLAHYAHEQWRGNDIDVGLDDHEVPKTPEALRALRGAVLRTEVYGLDGDPLQSTPYTVEVRRYAVRSLQPGRGGYPGVHALRTRHAITLDYERDASDPRVSHEIGLDFDDLGHALRTVNLFYPRRLAGLDQQTSGRISVNEHDFARTPPDSAAFRHGSEFQSRTWVVGNSGLAKALLGVEDVRQLLATAPAIRFDEVAPAGPYRRLVEHWRSYGLADDCGGPLPLGDVGALGLPHHSEKLVFDRAHLDAVFEDRAPDALLAELGYQKDGDEYWATGERRRFDPAQFHLADRVIDPLGRVVTTIEYDDYALLKTRVVDAAGNDAVATNDYRVLQPVEVCDTNGNREAVALDVRGVVVARAAMGSVGDGIDESVGGYDRFVGVDPVVDPHAYLQSATVAFTYDLFAWKTNAEPVWVHRLERVTNGCDLGPGQRTAVRAQRTYSNGLGREIQRKMLVRPGPAPVRGANGRLTWEHDGTLATADVSPRWVGSGNSLLNNKGESVVSHDPFYSASVSYESEPELTTRYPGLRTFRDALGRVSRTETPDGRITRATQTAWRLETADPNDSVLQSEWYSTRMALPASHPEHLAAGASAAHAGTVEVEHLDMAGETIRTEQTDASDGAVLGTSALLDDAGNRVALIDPRGVVVDRTDFDLLGNEIHRVRDGDGERFTLRDVLGTVVFSWDAADRMLRYRHDVLKRPLSLDVTENGVTRRTRVYEYADSAAEATRNRRGEVVRISDESGVREWLRFDHIGNPLETRRQLLLDPATAVDWLAGPALTGEWFTTIASFDATGAVQSRTTPDGTIVTHHYDDGGRLRKVTCGPDTTVADICYDARGRRQRIVYGNGVERTYTYDPVSGRTRRVLTRRAGDGHVFENLTITQDAVGNVVRMHDAAAQTVYSNNTRVDGTTTYEYDSLYRLVGTRGREHRAMGAQHYRRASTRCTESFNPTSAHPNDMQALRTYRRTFAYDRSGNLLQVRHIPSDGQGWTRHLRYRGDTNRLQNTDAGGSDPLFAASHDACGNLTGLPHVPNLTYDVHGHLVGSVRAGIAASYTFDATDVRVRKIVTQNGNVEERVSLGDFERFRRFAGGQLVFERTSVNVSDDVGRVALVERRTVDTRGTEAAEPERRVRFLHGNHLGSVTRETDDTGQLISSEEYYPFGGSAFVAAIKSPLRRRYRYCGRKRDDENGLYHFGARSYAPWLGRWISPDPSGLAGGPNAYCYVSNNPVRSWDPNGREETGSTCDASPMTPMFELRFGLDDPPEVTFFNSYRLQLGTEFDARMSVAIGTEFPSPAGASAADSGTGTAPIPEEERSFWSRGGGTLVSGLGLIGIAALILTGPVGILAGLTAGMMLSGGMALTGVGAIHLAISPWTTAKMDRDLNQASRMVPTSPGSLVGLTAGAAIAGDAKGAELGATIGGLAEGLGSVGRGLGRMAIQEHRFRSLYGSGSYSWRYSKRLKPALRGAFGKGPGAERRTNSLFNFKGTATEFEELSHFVPQRWTKGREWLFNRPWNLKPMWGTNHALVDPQRWQFMTRGFKGAYEGRRSFGIQRLRLMTPDWMLETGFGVTDSGGLLLRNELLMSD